MSEEKAFAEELKDVKAALKTKSRFNKGALSLLKMMKEQLSVNTVKNLYHALDTLSHNCTKDGMYFGFSLFFDYIIFFFFCEQDFQLKIEN